MITTQLRTTHLSKFMISFIIPTYNEKGNLPAVFESLGKVAGKGDEIIFVDDSSPDGTAEEIKNKARSDKRIKLIERSGKQGLSSAIFRGMSEANGDTLVLIEADFPPEAKHLEIIKSGLSAGKDAVLSSRFMPGGGSRVGWHRIIASLALNKITAWYLKTPVTDFNNTLRGLKRASFLAVKDKIKFFTHPEFFTQLTYLMRKNGANFASFPVVASKRIYGASKGRKLVLATFRYLKNLPKIKRSYK